MTVSNKGFADMVHCSVSMASRLRNGSRLPSLELIGRIAESFGLDEIELIAQYRNGRRAFSKYLRGEVFGPADRRIEDL